MDALSRTWGHYGELVLPGMCTAEVAMCVFDASLCTTGEALPARQMSRERAQLGHRDCRALTSAGSDGWPRKKTGRQTRYAMARSALWTLVAITFILTSICF
jgi:hypothetical protein